MRNVADLVDMAAVKKQERKPWTAREAIVFLRTARAHRLYAAASWCWFLGLRRSEVLGLRWQDVDFEAVQFTPANQVQRAEGKLVLKDLKAESSKAVLPLPEFAPTLSKSADTSRAWNASRQAPTGGRRRMRTWSFHRLTEG
ncbi:hypothetical protein ACFWUW_05425 [Streptomyces sp. NPDC058655]|uniref:hypothetical protein n=1 Tax=Streptomyces sp. NPDC058655 TaxID=3346577 RepID=UPI0036691EE6